MAPPKRKAGGRVTPKGTKPGQLPKVAAPEPSGSGSDTSSGASVKRASTASSRYTPPTSRTSLESPRWVPILMFALLGLGMLVILFNYFGIVLPGAGDHNWYLVVGLVLILGGILTATQYR